MAENEQIEALQDEISAPVEVDLLIGFTGAVDEAALYQRIDACSRIASRARMQSIAIAYPSSGDIPANDVANVHSGIRFFPYQIPAADISALPWTIAAAAQRRLAHLAVELNAKAGVFLQSDLALLDEEALASLVLPVVEKECDLVVPVYPSRRFEALLNHGILSPLTRALYGMRIQYPLAQDNGFSRRMLEKIAAHSTAERGSGPLFWPVTIAALSGYRVCQVNVAQSHSTQTDGVDLSTIIGSVVGSIFSEMETYAPQWQRVRGSQSTSTWGMGTAIVNDGEPVNAKPLIDSFLLGAQNLQEIWGLVLPPVTLLELKRIGRVAMESFRIPDALWARVIYDFALAHRLRRINRGHLLGALTPIYLGWVASYVQEVAGASPLAAEQRFEQLARAYEESKPYLISRWRWPDRFNP